MGGDGQPSLARRRARLVARRPAAAGGAAGAAAGRAAQVRCNVACTAMVRGDWNKGLWDYELVFGPVVDELGPDLVHAHDFRMLGVGARAHSRAHAAGRAIKVVWDAHEFLPGVKPGRTTPVGCRRPSRVRAGVRAYADAVMTVSRRPGRTVAEPEHRLAKHPAGRGAQRPGRRPRRADSGRARAGPARSAAWMAPRRRCWSTAGSAGRSSVVWTPWWRRCHTSPGAPVADGQ